ncbi:MAG: outer membrane protein assembly factor BamA, partial [Rickettsiaceae bacterium]|nr:outer membrane protein assembly factor BamA [Rickettsiaceae bacterium]
YRLGTINVQNNIPDIDTEIIKKLISLNPGAIFNMSALEWVGQKISDELGNRGYPQMSIVPTLQKDSVNRVVNVTFIVNKAPKVFINRINITGNVKTSEKVIRREFRIAEGDIFNRNELARADRGIRNLDYFERSDIKIVKSPDAADRYDVNIDVQEKSTASIGFDVGYSSNEGGFGSISFAERNLFGTGKYLNAMVRRSQRRLSFSLGMTDPHFMDRDLSLSGTFFTHSSGAKSGSGFDGEAQPYSQTTVGVRTALGYEIADDLYHEIAYTIKQDKLSTKSERQSLLILEQKGRFVTSAISHTVTYNRLDNNVVPKNGYVVSGSQEYAGLGGNTGYLKHEVDGKIFKSFSNNRITIKVYGEAGVINGINGKTVRISERFSLGDYNLRGFAGGGAGPRIKAGRQGGGEGLNGQKYYSGGVEMTFPVGLPDEMNVKGAVFTDIGGVWDFEVQKGSRYNKDDVWNDKSPRMSVGAGVLWTTRIMPIRVDWAIPVRYKKYDEQQRFHIRMSTSF